MRRLLLSILVLLSVIGALPASAAATEPRAPVLARGAALHGANGVMFDRRDRLFIASVTGREIVVMDPRTGAILDRLGPDRGVEGPTRSAPTGRGTAQAAAHGSGMHDSRTC